MFAPHSAPEIWVNKVIHLMADKANLFEHFNFHFGCVLLPTILLIKSQSSDFVVEQNFTVVIIVLNPHNNQFNQYESCCNINRTGSILFQNSPERPRGIPKKLALCTDFYAIVKRYRVQVRDSQLADI